MSIFSSIFEILDSARVALLDLQFKMIRSSFFFYLRLRSGQVTKNKKNIHIEFY